MATLLSGERKGAGELIVKEICPMLDEELPWVEISPMKKMIGG